MFTDSPASQESEKIQGIAELLGKYTNLSTVVCQADIPFRSLTSNPSNSKAT